MKGKVAILEKNLNFDSNGLDVKASFTINYEDGQSISASASFGKYGYTDNDILTCIQKYFKGDLKFYG